MEHCEMTISDKMEYVVLDGEVVKSRDGRVIDVEEEKRKFSNIMIVEDGTAEIYCSEDMVRSLINHEKLRLKVNIPITIYGENMEPKILNPDMVLVYKEDDTCKFGIISLNEDLYMTEIPTLMLDSNITDELITQDEILELLTDSVSEFEVLKTSDDAIRYTSVALGIPEQVVCTYSYRYDNLVNVIKTIGNGEAVIVLI